MRLPVILAMVAAATGAPSAASERLPPGAAACTGCHDAPADGASGDAFRSLAELSPEAIAAALAAFRLGERSGTLMPRIAKGFTDRESRAIAAALGRAKAAP